MKSNWYINIVIVLLVIMFGYGIWNSQRLSDTAPSPAPEQETTEKSTEEVTSQEATTSMAPTDKSDLIQVDTPKSNQAVSSPLVIEGQARGTWFFEGSFSVELLDENGNPVATAAAQAQEDWMIEEFVAFQTELKFNMPSETQATLVLEKANPSGLPEHADELRIPVVVSNKTQ